MLDIVVLFRKSIVGCMGLSLECIVVKLKHGTASECRGTDYNPHTRLVAAVPYIRADV